MFVFEFHYDESAAMFRTLWQTAMIGLARRAPLKRAMQAWAPASELAGRYVGGRTMADAIETARELSDRGISASLYYMGEYHTRPDVIRENTARKVEIARELGKSGLDIHVSVDPTQIGLSLDEDLCRENAFRIAAEIRAYANRPGRHCLMLDMEDRTATDATIALYKELKEEGLPAAVTLQAYLHRSEHDLEILITGGAFVRLVHGAFAEGAKHAIASFSGVKRNYKRLADVMLSRKAREAGVYPVFATHDENLHRHIVETAQENGWAPDDFEFEMLFGARPEVEADLIRRGWSLRLYLPFGEDWWPYAMRRIGESPRNAHILARAVFRR